MIVQYIQKAMEKAHYEIIDDDEPYYGEIPVCPGVWATGKTLEECRRNLEEVLEGWIIVRLQRGLDLPPIEGVAIRLLEEMPAHA
jgi:predicted RNase H-like HicB family nuclease